MLFWLLESLAAVPLVSRTEELSREAIFADIELVGRLLGTQDAASREVTKLRERVSAVEKASPGTPQRRSAAALIFGRGTPAPEEWFPPLVDRSSSTLPAYAGIDRPVGYLVALALTSYPDALAVAEHRGMHPPDTGYLAELGVSPAHRRHGITTTLLARVIDQRRSRAWLVRTLENNTAAIALYQRYGFELVPDVLEVRHGRRRVFLVKL